MSGDKITQHAIQRFGAAEPTEAQLDQAEAECAQAALKPFFDPKLRELVIAIKSSIGQVIDEITTDVLEVAQPVAPVAEQVQQRYTAWLEEKAKADVLFNPDATAREMTYQ